MMNKQTYDTTMSNFNKYEFRVSLLFIVHSITETRAGKT